MRHFFFLLSALLSLFLPLSAQLSLRVGTDIPLQYAAGADWQFHRNASVGIKAGVLTTPYNDAIISILDAFGTDDIYLSLIENTFQLGAIYEVNGNGHWGKNYAGLYGQVVLLQAADAPSDLMETVLGVNIPSPGAGPNAQPLELTLTSRLYQIGARYGRRFPIGDRFELRAEAGVSKNIGSLSEIYTNSRSTENLSDLINTELKPIYKTYAWLPSLGIYAVWRITGDQ